MDLVCPWVKTRGEGEREREKEKEECYPHMDIVTVAYYSP